MRVTHRRCTVRPCSAYADLDAAVARLRDAVAGAVQRLTLATSHYPHAVPGHAAGEEIIAQPLSALHGQAVVIRVGAHLVGMTGDQHLRRGTHGDGGED